MVCETGRTTTRRFNEIIETYKIEPMNSKPFNLRIPIGD
jgi:hypothetical protein